VIPTDEELMIARHTRSLLELPDAREGQRPLLSGVRVSLERD
jgi:hypothetical protein